MWRDRASLASAVSALALALVLTGAAAEPALAGLGDSPASKNRAGNRLYEKEKYDEALAQYRAAQVIAPELLELFFNSGDALYRKGDLEDAAREFGKAAASPDDALASDAHYNAGNAFLDLGQAGQAIAEYTNALKRNPGHEDAKHNLELALRLLQQQQQQQQQNQQDQQNQQNDQNQQNQDQQQEQQQDQSQKEQEEQDQQNQDQQNQDQQSGQQDEQQQDQEQNQQQAQAQESGMSKEDAERLLDAVGEEERELQAELRAEQARKRSKVDKDW